MLSPTHYFRRPLSRVSQFPAWKATPASHSDKFVAPIGVAYQPIYKVSDRSVFAYEALARTADGLGYQVLMKQVNECNRFSFDQKCREAAMESASRLGLGTTGASLSLNINPSSVLSSQACIDNTIRVADKLGIPLNRIILEITEDERSKNPVKLNKIVQLYRQLGVRVAIDDFGAGYAGLSLLAHFSADIVKIDIELVRNIDRKDKNRAIVDMIIAMASRLGMEIIAEGVETEQEYRTLRSLGVDMLQGYLLARPGFQFLPITYSWTALERPSLPA